ncbi:MAG: hypothetical protein LBS62_10450 [Clostridiales bacterium]|nr:hypothetical protein [Clostridiales bacterium]
MKAEVSPGAEMSGGTGTSGGAGTSAWDRNIRRGRNVRLGPERPAGKRIGKRANNYSGGYRNGNIFDYNALYRVVRH